MFSTITYHARCMIDGLIDGLSISSMFKFYIDSSIIRLRCAQCAVLNGGLFLMSVLVAEYGMRPLIDWLIDGSMGWWVDVCINLFYAAYVCPLMLISLALNSIWYQEIAAEANRLINQSTDQTVNPSTKQTINRSINQSNVFDRWAVELYRLLLFAVLSIFTQLLSFLPLIDWLMCVLYWSWLYSLYSFDYNWAINPPINQSINQSSTNNMNQSLNTSTNQSINQLTYFESRWSYFFGFGFPFGLLTIMLRSTISTPIIAITFPFSILIAATATPKPINQSINQPNFHAVNQSIMFQRLPIFTIPKYLNYAILKAIQLKVT